VSLFTNTLFYKSPHNKGFTEQVSLETCIREMLGSNLGQDTVILTKFSGYSSGPPDQCRQSGSIKPRPLNSMFFPIPAIRRYIISTLTALFNNP
jgi:hypothetical protein